jgi:hypothetical protein
MLYAGSLSSVFVNQSYWQTGITAKPKASVCGFLGAGLVWFMMPWAFGASLGMAYWALSLQQGKQLVNENDALQGMLNIV